MPNGIRNHTENVTIMQEIQFDHQTDSDPIGFHLISMKPYRHRSHGTISRFLISEFYGILISELNEIQCNFVTDSIGDSRE